MSLRSLFALALLCLGCAAHAQIPAAVTSGGETNYNSTGEASQPFTLELIDARRTVSNTLLVRLGITNNGAAALAPAFDFALPGQAVDNGTVSGVYAVDPNGQGKFGIVRGSDGKPLCSVIEPALQPGERRQIFAQLAAPPSTSSVVTIVFPKARAIVGVPIGLPTAGQAIPPEASIGDPGHAPAPTSPLPQGTAAAIDQPGTNYRPDLYTNQQGLAPSGSSGVGIGSVQSANSDTPFTVEAMGVERTGPDRAVLHLALTNNGSGVLEAAGQFAAGISDPADAQKISGVYLIDPKSKQRLEVVRETQTAALCSKIDPALKPGERRLLEAQFPAPAAGVASMYVYFPHAAPIANVPVTP